MSAPKPRDLVLDSASPAAQLMGRPSERRRGECAACGAACEPVPTRVALGMPARAVVDGRFAGNPVFDLCPACAGALQEGRMHLRWAERPRGGRWERLFSPRPVPRAAALRSRRGWRGLGR